MLYKEELIRVTKKGQTPLITKLFWVGLLPLPW